MLCSRYYNLCITIIMCTFAAAKVIIALAKCYQYAEIERFSLRKEGWN